MLSHHPPSAIALLLSGPALMTGGFLAYYVRSGLEMPVSAVLIVLALLGAAYKGWRPGTLFSSKFSIYLIGAAMCLLSVFLITNALLSVTVIIWLHVILLFLAGLSCFQEAKLLRAFETPPSRLLWGAIFLATLGVAFFIPLDAGVTALAGLMLSVTMRYSHTDEETFANWLRRTGDQIRRKDFYLDNYGISFWAAIAFTFLSAFTTNTLFDLLCALVVCISLMQIFDRRWPFAVCTVLLLLLYNIPLP